MSNAQIGGLQVDTSPCSFYQRPPFHGAYNAPKGPHSQLVVAQSCIPPVYNEINIGIK